MQTFNRYTYVLNNPIKYTDPTGHYPTDEADGFDNGGYDNPYEDDPEYWGTGEYGHFDNGVPKFLLTWYSQEVLESIVIWDNNIVADAFNFLVNYFTDGEKGIRGFTFGVHQFYVTGEFDPDTPEGIALIGHETKHTEQYAQYSAQGFIGFYMVELYNHGYENRYCMKKL